MTHRADQVLDAVVAKLKASTTLGIPRENIFAHRSQSISEEQAEVPAVTVNYGGDAPIDAFGPDAEIDSELTINVAAYFQGTDEAEVRRGLLAARTAIHVALLTDYTLGLAFVVVTRYGGASAPTVDSSSGSIIGELTSTFAVHYRMNSADPS